MRFRASDRMQGFGQTAAFEQTELGHLQVGLGNSTARLPKVGPRMSTYPKGSMYPIIGYLELWELIEIVIQALDTYIILRYLDP